MNLYLNVHIYCGIQGNNRSLDKRRIEASINESNVIRQKIKPVVESGLKNKDYDVTLKYVD